FLGELQHWQQRHIRSTVSHRALYAGVMALGCGIGIQKMGRISSQITENELVHAVNWYFSLDNIQAANDRVIKFMDEMDLPRIYQKSQDKLHTASDGQKFEVRTDSLNANHWGCKPEPPKIPSSQRQPRYDCV
ncbi:MAG: transposase, partial [Chloroflexi bacterium]|nr:transposase [Chloroflexota bacterium]